MAITSGAGAVRNSFFLFAVAVLVIVPPTFARTWVDNTGKYRVEAELIHAENGYVLLRKSDGRTTKVAVERLSQADQDYVDEQAAVSHAHNQPAEIGEPTEPTVAEDTTPQLPVDPPMDGMDSDQPAAFSESSPGSTNVSSGSEEALPAAPLARTPPVAEEISSNQWLYGASTSDIVRLGALLVLAVAAYGVGGALVLGILLGGCVAALMHFNTQVSLPVILIAALAAAFCLPALLGIIATVAKMPAAIPSLIVVLGLPTLLISRFALASAWTWSILDAGCIMLLLPFAFAGIRARIKGEFGTASVHISRSYVPTTYSSSGFSRSDVLAFSDSPRPVGRSEARTVPPPKF